MGLKKRMSFDELKVRSDPFAVRLNNAQPKRMAAVVSSNGSHSAGAAVGADWALRQQYGGFPTVAASSSGTVLMFT